ncbi:MAG: hypothetical protein FD153_1142 [Rhodospirillaceae bacterium]|nr:MAG: hypothetical protein FD153_1142 [Rhodospirillaceae bacterium]
MTLLRSRIRVTLSSGRFPDRRERVTRGILRQDTCTLSGVFSPGGVNSVSLAVLSPSEGRGEVMFLSECCWLKGRDRCAFPSPPRTRRPDYPSTPTFPRSRGGGRGSFLQGEGRARWKRGRESEGGFPPSGYCLALPLDGASGAARGKVPPFLFLSSRSRLKNTRDVQTPPPDIRSLPIQCRFTGYCFHDLALFFTLKNKMVLVRANVMTLGIMIGHRLMAMP